MLTSRERVQLALAHQEPDRVPLDLGASSVTGMHVDSVYLLRQALGLDEPGTPVKVVEPYQMLGEIAPDLIERLGVDVIGLGSPRNMFGYENKDWKEWRTFAGTPVWVPADFNTTLEPDGSLMMYAEGDRSFPPAARMPAGGWFFDSLKRQPPLPTDADGNERLDPADNLEEFGPITDADLEYFRLNAERLFTETEQAILGNFGGTAFGDIALVPAPFLKNPRGIRDVEEWYISTISRRDYVLRVFERQCEIALANLAKIHAVVGERVSAVFITGTDFGTQNGPFISPRAYRTLYKPFHEAVNGWIHTHTTWKTFIHSCGSVHALIPDFIEAGFDILNPVQCSAAGMDAVELKRDFGDRVTFWGGGVDTQHTLPFGTPEDVRNQVHQRARIFGKGGGFVFNPVHNVQSQTPIENLTALYDTFNRWRNYPLT